MRGGKSMDLLKAALAERQAKAQKLTSEAGTKWIKRSVLEEQRKEEYLEDKRREEEKQAAEDEAHMEKLKAHLTSRKRAREEEETAAKLPEIDEALLDDDDAEPPIGIDTVIERLRELGQPITLFGETDMQRYKRSRQIEKDIHEGKKNPDLLMLEQHQAKQMREEAEMAESMATMQMQFQEPVADDKSDSEDDDEEKGMKVTEENGVTPDKPAEPEDDADVAIDTAQMDRCDFLRSWIRKTMKAWEKDIADRPEEEKKKATNKLEIAQHRQCRRDIRPLQRRLRMYRLEEHMLEKVEPIIQKADKRLYRDAAEEYIELTIGKAAWPVGVGCGGSMLMEDAIGLHDRFNRMENVKDTAHALNDEVARKYVQAIKRLMSVAQKFWPPENPSQMSG